MIYFITIGKHHIIPALICVKTLKALNKNKIIIAGNLAPHDKKKFTALGAEYIDENDINLKDRFPAISWNEKYRNSGWYKQQFLRLSIDRYIKEDLVFILDSEFFPFSNWDESRFFEPDRKPRYLHWISSQRKPDWDYKMYRGAAYLLAGLPECKEIMTYANSDNYQRHISGVQIFSTKNLAHLWSRLTKETDLELNLHTLFNKSDLAFSDYDFYGMANTFNLFEKITPTATYNNLLGWYDVHDDHIFNQFKSDAMWSMCQRYPEYPTEHSYYKYMKNIASMLGREVIKIPVKHNFSKKIIGQFIRKIFEF
ncbi:hypothetical protein RVIR1_05460 [Candidatus Rickettsiella viridis]|uniref:Uncharacterized protein n=1 Tax=Candidatus Rickettsiella viridis TaxID=676208 RepID=A0A2Z5UU43_9COXI|nr:DUF6492 family protein [Candidatus Rickettsiella viridis]BBB15049.1 hypothetical protein RVIR1_05460 [Candidatus Rickettsiella viridis]